MTCREMELLLREISVEREAAPPDATEHLAACPHCSAKLEQERQLTASLKTLAGGADAVAVPATVQAMEARLRIAFRENRRERNEPSRRVLQLIARRPLAWAAGIAAILIFSLGVGLRDSRLPETGPETETLAVNPAPATEMKAEPVERTPAENAARPDSVRRTARGAMNGLPEADAVPAGSRVTAVPPAGEQAAPDQPPQFRSEFFPLFYGGDPQLLEAGQVWRVEMPRAALRSVGMPVMEEYGPGRIQVDILLGEDGIARAIRFVE